jgi:hypothetical protein
MSFNIDMDKVAKFYDEICELLNNSGNAIEEDLISLQRVIGIISLKIAYALDIEVADKEKFIKGFVSAFGNDISRFFNGNYEKFKKQHDNRKVDHKKNVESLKKSVESLRHNFNLKPQQEKSFMEFQEKSVMELFDELIKNLKDIEK